MRQLNQLEQQKKILEIAEICNGLNVWQTKHLLKEAYWTIREGCLFSTDSPAFKEKIKTDFYELSQLLSEDLQEKSASGQNDRHP